MHPISALNPISKLFFAYLWSVFLSVCHLLTTCIICCVPNDKTYPLIWHSRLLDSGHAINPPPPGLFLYPPQPGGGRIRPPLLSRKRMDVERRTRRHSKDLDETHGTYWPSFESSKLRSRVRSRSGQRSKSDVFRLQTVVTSNVACFAQNFPYVLPRTRQRYWRVKLFHI